MIDEKKLEELVRQVWQIWEKLNLQRVFEAPSQAKGCKLDVKRIIPSGKTGRI